DFVSFLSRFDPESDIFTVETYDLATSQLVDLQAVNARLGDIDTALFDSNTLVMPVSIAALGLSASNSRISYSVMSVLSQTGLTLDVVGGDDDSNVDGTSSV